jgi:hypothetical protein
MIGLNLSSENLNLKRRSVSKLKGKQLCGLQNLLTDGRRNLF